MSSPPFDHITAHPEHLRILDWARLEGIDGVDGIVERAGLGDPVGTGWPDQFGTVADAQRAGTVRRDVTPATRASRTSVRCARP